MLQAIKEVSFEEKKSMPLQNKSHESSDLLDLIEALNKSEDIGADNFLGDFKDNPEKSICFDVLNPKAYWGNKKQSVGQHKPIKDIWKKKLNPHAQSFHLTQYEEEKK